jgi:putative membrane protein
MDKDSEIRDMLALERTRLANERTFLAYIRTGLSMLAGAAVLFQFFASIDSYVAAGWVLVVCAVLVLLFGTYRFMQVRATLNKRLHLSQDRN